MQSVSKKVGTDKIGFTIHTALVPLFCEECRKEIAVAEDFIPQKRSDGDWNCICSECYPFELVEE